MHMDIKEISEHFVPDFSVAAALNPVALIGEIQVAMSSVPGGVGDGWRYRVQSVPQLLCLTDGHPVSFISVNHQHRYGNVLSKLMWRIRWPWRHRPVPGGIVSGLFPR